jgi:DNA invertase Pin-like site-specific DNA recombinase
MTRSIERGKIPKKEWKKIVALFHQAKEEAERANEPPHEPTAYGYRRCSHEDSKASGLGLEVQDQTITRYYDLLAAKLPEVKWGKLFSDEAVSAFRRRLVTRPDGAELNRILKAGDHVIFPRLDRGFRNLKDLLSTLDDWTARGITIHFVAEGIDMTTAAGRMILQILGSVAEWQSNYISERGKEVNRRLRQTGRVPANWLPMGFKIQHCGNKGARRWVVDPEKRQWMCLITKLREKQKWTFREISNYCEMVIAKHEHRLPLPEYEMGKRQWSLQKCRKAYIAELRLREMIAAARAAGHKCLLINPDIEISMADLMGHQMTDLPDPSQLGRPGLDTGGSLDTLF